MEWAANQRPRVRFDTNVYDAIEKGETSTEEVRLLSDAVASGRIDTHLNVADVEELLGDWAENRATALKRLRVARDLVGFDYMLKSPSDLLKEAIQAYAAGALPPTPFLPHPEQRLQGETLILVSEGDGDLSALSAGLADVRAKKELFRANMFAADKRTQTEWERRWGRKWPKAIERRALKFEDFWVKGALKCAEEFADLIDCGDACRQRGLDGLLDIRIVKLAVIATAALLFAQLGGDGSEPRQPRLGDGYDLWHAVLAGTADMFVTYDERLAKGLNRIPVEGFRSIYVQRGVRGQLASALGV